jgi:serine/threonine protein kinase
LRVERLGPYEVLAPLGAGGMGEVYRARDERLGREVAIKVLPTDSSSDPVRLRRFELEARTVGALNHPNLITVFDTGQHEGNPYVVFELLDGVTLRQRLGTGPLPVRKAVDYAVQIANGLAAAPRVDGGTYSTATGAGVVLGTVGACRRSRSGEIPPTIGPTSSPSARCFTRCSRRGERLLVRPPQN